MKELWSKWIGTSLIVRILIFMVVGLILALIIPDVPVVTPVLVLLGNLFVGALKAVAPILVFFLVIGALANAKTAGGMKTVIVLYLVSTFVASLVAVLASYLFPTSLTLQGAEGVEQTAASGIGEVLTTLVTNMVANPVSSLVNANYIGILVWAVIIGIALRAASENTRSVFGDIATAITTVVKWIINFAPFGILGLVYNAVATSGPEIFTEYGHLVAVLVLCMIFIALVTNPLIVFIAARINPYPLVLRALRDSGITAFFTRSSAANIPVNLELCRKMHLDENNYSVSIPLGATINMAGAAVTITVMAMAAHYTVTGTLPDIPTAVIMSALAAISAAGASGVPGGSLMLIPLACSLFGIGNDIAMQVVAVGFIVGVIQDSCETALNSSSDVVFTATAEYRTWKQEGRKVDFSAWEK
ncbi:Na(+)/serine-threonine symporter [Slackia heliotrinireducens]|uniref:Na+/serine symporter n=1 Tax=Slackia heliotrinireducens (strain ATCC 29202 / DSM 20476 / NCTC 11029 / RHS 1) TaxID=471855 RepID=C7N5A7_SLAHD|nr:serine/threonine transporter SstT [Slackia heliotrinireducens]ACV22092.1 Na+/serine symporter [Slackia heliotrinireducens DSM 20476]VEH00087.1 Na(+)/serine-threonine symporter [Slackia heliotrinireducens]